MDANFWLERWKQHDIGFHQPKPQPALIKHWTAVGAPRGSTILVPLAGKSLDMVWLAEQGHRILGIELSALAIDEFFAENGLSPGSRQEPGFVIKSAGPYELRCGDLFAVPPAATVGIAAVYDRAALVAMPPEMQTRYVAKIAELMPAATSALVIGLDYNAGEMQGPPFAIPQARMRALFEPQFEVTLCEARDGLAKNENLIRRGVTRLEEATYLMKRRR